MQPESVHEKHESHQHMPTLSTVQQMLSFRAFRVFRGPVFSVFLLVAFSFSLTAHAAATDKLKSFITATRSAQANFTQEVQDKNGKRLQSASGTMQFVRPGKFRWEYRKPYAQLIVGDGKKFWMYDTDLNQVTVKRLDAALGSSPAALLSGSNEIERGFTLKNIEAREGLDWLQATPKSSDTSFEKILMAFNAKSQLVVMELHDAFGNHTVLRFSDLINNPAVPAQRFTFVPPKGADVLGE